MDIEKLSYEEAINELEKILELLENEESTLEDSINNFKRGIELHKYCSNILNKTEGEVKILLENEDNILREEIFSEGVD